VAGNQQMFDTFTLGSQSLVTSITFDVSNLAQFFPNWLSEPLTLAIYNIGPGGGPGTELFSATFTPDVYDHINFNLSFATALVTYNTHLVLNPGTYLITYYNQDGLGAIGFVNGGSDQAFAENLSNGTTALVGESLGFNLSGEVTSAIPPGIMNVAPTVVEKSQTTVIATVAPGVPGDTLTLTETAGLGALSLGPVQSDGTQQVIYMAPASIAASAIDEVTYTINESDGASATGSANVQLDAGPTIIAAAAVHPGQTVEIGTVTPGLAGDTLTLAQSSGPGTVTLVNNNGVQDVMYTAPTGVGSNTLVTVTYAISDQHNDAIATGGAIIGGNGSESIVGGSAGGTAVILGTGPDTVTLSGLGNAVSLGNGPDTVTGGQGSTTVTVGNGIDRINLGGSNNQITGGNGSDSVTTGDNSTISLGNGHDNVTAGSNSTINLGNGADTVTAGANSIISVGNGADTVTAGASSTITIGNGNDTIYVGRGDTVTVGTGHDSFVFQQTASGNVGAVTINHFDPSKDVITFSSQLTTAVSYQDNNQGNAVITVDNAGDTITLVGVHSSALHPSDFNFA
jgi:hypothetical protein